MSFREFIEENIDPAIIADMKAMNILQDNYINDFYFTWYDDSASLKKKIKKFPQQIHLLYINYCHFSLNDIRNLTGTKIQILRILNYHIPINHLIYLNYSNLQEITLSIDEIIDSELKYLSHVNSLTLYNGLQITDYGMKYLGITHKLSLIKFPKITDRGLECLTHVQHLKMNNCDKITYSGLRVINPSVLCIEYKYNNTQFPIISHTLMIKYFNYHNITIAHLKTWTHIKNIHFHECNLIDTNGFKYLVETVNLFFFHCNIRFLPTDFESMPNIKNIYFFFCRVEKANISCMQIHLAKRNIKVIEYK